MVLTENLKHNQTRIPGVKQRERRLPQVTHPVDGPPAGRRRVEHSGFFSWQSSYMISWVDSCHVAISFQNLSFSRSLVFKISRFQDLFFSRPRFEGLVLKVSFWRSLFQGLFFKVSLFQGPFFSRSLAFKVPRLSRFTALHLFGWLTEGDKAEKSVFQESKKHCFLWSTFL
jgi:hypothetical protein